MLTQAASMALDTAVQPQSTASGPMQLLAAGSLRDAMNAMKQLFEQESGVSVNAAYGPSGKLRGDIEGGRRMDVFASASIEHTNILADKGLLASSLLFTHNELCVASTPAAGVTESNLLEALAQPALRLATSTPVSDPMGDYTWQFFKKADQAKAGLYGIFDNKAMKLSGATTPAPGEKLPYVTAFEADKADAYIMYCTNAMMTKQSVKDLVIIRIPDALNVRSNYGIGAHPDSTHGQRFVDLVMSERGQAILKQYGFN